MPKLECRCGAKVDVMVSDYNRLTKNGTVQAKKLAGCGVCRASRGKSKMVEEKVTKEIKEPVNTPVKHDYKK